MAGRVVASFVAASPTAMIGVLVAVAVLLLLSRSAFNEQRAVIDVSPRWWIAFGLAIAGTLWVAFVEQARDVTQRVMAEGGVMLGVTSITLSGAIVYAIHRRRARPT